MMLRFWKLLPTPNKWLETQQTSILSAATILTVATFISSAAGLIRQRVLLTYFFNTDQAKENFEAFLVAFQIPDMLFQLLVLGALSAAFIPTFTSLKKKDPQVAFKMSAILMNILLIFFVVTSLIVGYFAEPLTALRTGPDFSPEQVRVAAQLTQIMLVAQVFFAVSNFLSGILQSHQRFIMPALSPLLYNVGIVIGVALLSSQIGIYSAGVGVVFGAFLHMIIQWPLAYKLGFRYRLSLALSFPGIKEILTLMPPRFLALSITELQQLALGFFATSVGDLGYVVIRLALTLMSIPIRLFGVPIGQASLPFLSDKSEETDLVNFKKLVVDSLHQIAFLAMPASILLLILRVPIVRLAYGTPDFPWATTLMTGRAVAIIAISVTAQAMVHLLLRAFHALKDTRTPLVITFIEVSVYLSVAAYTVFYTSWGVLGLALATTIAAILELVLAISLLSRKLPGLFDTNFVIPQMKMLFASFLMAVFLYLPFRIFDELVFDTSRTVELIALTVTTGTIGMLVYVVFAKLFEVEQLTFLTKLVYSFGRWQKTLAKSNEMINEPSTDGDEI